MAKKSDHKVHKYEHLEMVDGNPNTKLWACRLSGCSHIMPKHYEKILPGKSSICWECGKEFVLDLDSMVDDRPKCFECRTGIKINDEDELLTIVNQLRNEGKI